MLNSLINQTDYEKGIDFSSGIICTGLCDLFSLQIIRFSE